MPPNSSTLPTVTLTLSSPIVKGPLPILGTRQLRFGPSGEDDTHPGRSTARARSTMTEGGPTHSVPHVRTLRPVGITLDHESRGADPRRKSAGPESPCRERVPASAMHSTTNVQAWLGALVLCDGETEDARVEVHSRVKVERSPPVASSPSPDGCNPNSDASSSAAFRASSAGAFLPGSYARWAPRLWMFPLCAWKVSQIQVPSDSGSPGTSALA